MSTGILATKLYRPPLPAKHIPRPHLSNRLEQGLALGRQMTLVSAPAGFGKTTCISAWVHSLKGMPVAWLSLEPGDDDPGRFFMYFTSAVQQIFPGLGQDIQAALHAGQIPPVRVISASMINGLLEMRSQAILVLDDFQVLQDRIILQFVEELVANPSHPLHLVIITREDPPLPLARLRANNQLTEIWHNFQGEARM